MDRGCGNGDSQATHPKGVWLEGFHPRPRDTALGEQGTWIPPYLQVAE
jgi:hypothetical protein